MNISEKEKLLLENIRTKFPKNGDSLHRALVEVFSTYPKHLLNDKYDIDTVRSFLHALMQDSSKKGHEQYMQIVFEDETHHVLKQKCLGADDLLQSMMKSLGSSVITQLIEDTMMKMSETEFDTAQIENLVDLVKMRNKLRQAEQKFLETAFVRYLDAQIEVLSKQL